MPVKRIILTVLIFIVLSITFSLINQAITPSVSIHSQLSDSYEDAASYKLYKELLSWSWILYPITAVLMFTKELKKLLTKKEQ